MKNDEVNILMTGAGAPGAAGIIKCLKKDKSFHVVSADADPQALGKHLTDIFIHIPRGDDAAFIPTVLDVCRKNNIHVVMPLVTRELIPLAKHINDFEFAGVKLLVAPVESLEIANNKSRLYEFLQWRGLPVPGYRVIEKAEQLDEACRELDYPEKNITIKPSISNGSRGFRIISEKFNQLDLFLNYKPGHQLITRRELKDILASGPMPEMLLSEYLPGEEYSIDCLCKKGEPLLIVPRLRRKIINGITVEGEFHKEEQIISYCSAIIKELNLHGNVGIQVKRSETGQFLILEINPRVQGTISSALGAGVNFPVLAVKLQLGLPIHSPELEVKWGVRFGRYWEEIFY